MLEGSNARHGELSSIIRTCEQNLEMTLVACSLVAKKLDGIKSCRVAPKVLCGDCLILYKAILIHIRMGRNSVLLHPVWLPIGTLERRLAVALVGAPVCCLTRLAAVLFRSQWTGATARQGEGSHRDQKTGFASCISRRLAACAQREVCGGRRSHGDDAEVARENGGSVSSVLSMQELRLLL